MTIARGLGALLALPVLIALAGCGDEDGGTESLVIFERSGGFAGLTEELRIETNGRVEFSEEVAGEPRRSTVSLSPKRLDRLRDLLDSVPIDSLPEPDPDSICADCFSYALTYAGSSWVGNDLALTPEATRLITELNEIALPGEAE